MFNLIKRFQTFDGKLFENKKEVEAYLLSEFQKDLSDRLEKNLSENFKSKYAYKSVIYNVIIALCNDIIDMKNIHHLLNGYLNHGDDKINEDDD